MITTTTTSINSTPTIKTMPPLRWVLISVCLLLAAPMPIKAFNGAGWGGDDDSGDSSDSDEEDHREEVSFQGQNAAEHFTMKVEEGHRFKCFETKEELVDAVDRYQGYNHIDMEMAEQYGWPIGNWCIHDITDLSDLFYDHQHFNEDIGKWNTAKVTDMTAMFQNALEFSQDLSLWDTSRVTSMSRMFAAAKSFNADITQWDVSKVESTSYMFLHALAFNQDISDWNVDNIKDMERMLRDARTFKFRERVERKWNIGDDQEGINTHRMLSDNCGEEF